MFGLVPKPIWAKLIPADERNAIPQNANVLLVELADGRKGLVDSGCGSPARFTEKELQHNGLGQDWPLMANLAALGVEPAGISFVLLTHLHWDHAGGATCGREGETFPLTFPNATLFVHAVEWQDAMSGNPLLYQSYPRGIVAPLEAAPPATVRLVEGEEAEVLPGIRMVRTGGHTRGHCAVVLEAADLAIRHPGAGGFSDVHKLVFAADVCPTSHHLRLVYQTAYDTFPLDTRAWKKATLPAIAEEASLLCFDHDPQLFAATIRTDEKKEFVVAKGLAVAQPGRGGD